MTISAETTVSIETSFAKTSLIFLPAFLILGNSFCIPISTPSTYFLPASIPDVAGERIPSSVSTAFLNFLPAILPTLSIPTIPVPTPSKNCSPVSLPSVLLLVPVDDFWLLLAVLFSLIFKSICIVFFCLFSPANLWLKSVNALSFTNTVKGVCFR